MAEPTEDEVRAWLESERRIAERGAAVAREVSMSDRAYERLRVLASSALALLDEARKDRERLDWIDGAFWCDYARSAVGVAEITAGTLVTHLAIGEGDTVRAAIDQARGA